MENTVRQELIAGFACNFIRQTLQNKFDIILKVHHTKLYNKTEMNFLEFYSVNILYMFRIGKLFIFRRKFYCTCSLWCVSCIHVDWLLPQSRWKWRVCVCVCVYIYIFTYNYTITSYKIS